MGQITGPRYPWGAGYEGGLRILGPVRISCPKQAHSSCLKGPVLRTRNKQKYNVKQESNRRSTHKFMAPSPNTEEEITPELLALLWDQRRRSSWILRVGGQEIPSTPSQPATKPTCQNPDLRTVHQGSNMTHSGSNIRAAALPKDRQDTPHPNSQASCLRYWGSPALGREHKPRQTGQHH